MSRRDESPRGRGEGGAASLLAVSLLVLLAFVAVGAASVAAAVAAHRRAQSAADLAALAGASALQEAGDPCGRAGELAGRNEARLVGCSVAGEEVIVEVSVTVGDLVGGRWALTSSARAGPVG